MLAQVLLSFGYDKIVLLTRSMVLRGAGYTVEEVYRWHEAFNRAQSDLIDALLLCHSVPAAEQKSMITGIRAKRAHLPIFCVVRQSDFDPTTEGCIAVDPTPEELLEGLRLALCRTVPGKTTGHHSTGRR
jgi:CheY-like chemotaxis protein